ncbi:protein of unknown function [Nocardioides sp. YR527]|uniref:DUF4328 domain-containing protein n=1 Tax=Nocardioides sp. YR527 TaxID=1881028 RepID=UPI00088A5A9E|nr:DUF4328 domain-containing protein [Nocardioides sp. YR527]SDK02635.1 protein of unknown function [Nocardioides sp. YR527]
MIDPEDAPSTLPDQPASQHLPAVPRALGKAAIHLAVALTVIRLIGVAIVSVPAPGEWALDVLAASPVVAISIGIPLYVVATLWLLRSYDFARAVDPAFPMRRSRAWTWLGWWVPIVSLWFPFQIVDDVRRATAKGQARTSPAIWWAAWLIAVWTGQISRSAFGDHWTLVAVLDTVAAVAWAVACVMWISIIRGITRDQEAARG